MVKLAPRFSIVRFSNPLLGEVWLGTCLVLVHGCLIWKLERNVGLDRCCSLIPSMTEKIFVIISLIPWSPNFLGLYQVYSYVSNTFCKEFGCTIFDHIWRRKILGLIWRRTGWDAPPLPLLRSPIASPNIGGRSETTLPPPLPSPCPCCLPSSKPALGITRLFLQHACHGLGRKWLNWIVSFNRSNSKSQILYSEEILHVMWGVFFWVHFELVIKCPL